MLLSTKDQGLGRRRRSYSHGSLYSNSRARISKLSLASAITTQSSGSNGSNSTVTQESYNKSRAEATKRKRSKRKKETSETKSATMEAVDEEVQSEEACREDQVDVFAFLVEEDQDESDARQHHLPDVNNDIAVFDDDQEGQPSTQSPHSDSGISMDNGVYHLGEATLNTLLPAVQEEQRPTTSSDSSMPFKSDWKWPDVPKPSQFAHPTPHIPEFLPPSSLDVRRDSGHYLLDPYPACYTPATPEYPPLPWPALYDLLTSNSPDSEQRLQSLPLRRFRAADTRVLLHLQQDIYQLECELKELDSTILASTGPESSASSSRRPSRHLNQPYLHSARAEALHRLQLRLETYYKQLHLSRKIDQLSRNARPASKEIEQIRGMLKGDVTHGSLPLLGIFDEDEDLFTWPDTGRENPRSSCCLTAPAVAVSSLIPLLLFKIFTSMSTRILVISITLTISIWVIEHLHTIVSKGTCIGLSLPAMSGRDRKELKRWVLVGSAISMVMALVG